MSLSLIRRVPVFMRQRIRMFSIDTQDIRLQNVKYLVSDPTAAEEFYEDAAGFRPVHTKVARDHVRFGDPDTLTMTFQAADKVRTDTSTTSPSLVFAVSNIKTAVRQAKRRGGTIIEDVTTKHRDVPEAVVTDPFGFTHTFIHAFRRHPVLYVSLKCLNLHAMKAFYEQLGFEEVSLPTELAALHLPKDGKTRIVMTKQPYYAHTPLVLEAHADGAATSGGFGAELGLQSQNLDAVHALWSSKHADALLDFRSRAAPHIENIDPDMHVVTVRPSYA